LQAAPRSNGRLIEVIGDSISAGQGILGSETHPNGVPSPPCDGGPSNSSWFATYASLAGHALHAEVSTIARSGWGMYRDGTGATQGVLSRLYGNTLGSSDTPKWTFDRQPAVVVINLGTNDWNTGDPGPAFESAARDFIQRIRSHYPSAWIFLAIGSKLWGSQFDEANARLRSVAAACAAAGDRKVISFDLGIQNLGDDSMIPTGCSWHPSAAEHRRMASILRKQLAAKLGW
jgi:lysophospholipase L1-like esterase